ncbi:hypothetical protein J6Z19_01130 [bacterium]|nr:hypothetical protein [bacterium]
MSTVDFIAMDAKKNVSEFQALVSTIMNAPATSAVSAEELYSMAQQQTTVVISDQETPKIEGVLPENSTLISNFTGEDTEIDSFVKIVPTIEEAMSNPDSADEREELLEIARKAATDLIQREMTVHSVYLTDSADFNCKIDIAAPIQFPKLLLDTAIHYYPIDDKTSKNYSKSRKLDMPSIRIVCYPEWENEEWLYWKSKAHNETEDEPQRFMMIYDVETNSAMLLGAKTFAEIEKAVRVLAWNTAVEAGKGDFLPVSGTAKTIDFTKTVDKKSETISTTFLTISTDGSERGFFGLNIHAGENTGKGEKFAVSTSGDSGMLMSVSGQNRKKSLISFGRNRFSTMGVASAFTKGAAAPVSAENMALLKTAAGKKEFATNPLLSPCAKIHTVFEQEEKDLPMPEYVFLIVRDPALPPVTMVKDSDLVQAMWFSYSTECECCSDSEVIPGGNADATWEVEKEYELFSKAFKKGKFKVVLINTTPYAKNAKAIEDDVILSVYMKIAKNDMVWKEWKVLSGFYVPDKGVFKNVQKDFDAVYDPNKFLGNDVYTDLLRDSIEEKVEYLRTIDAPVNLINALYKSLAKLV